MKIKTNLLKKFFTGVIAGVLSLTMVAPMSYSEVYAAFTSGEVAYSNHYKTIYPATYTIQNGSCTSVYKITTDDGDYGYAMCAKSKGTGPVASSTGTLSVISSSTYSGTYGISMKVAPNQTVQVNKSRYQILQAAARAASEAATGSVDTDVYALLHMYASAIVSGDYTYIADSNQLGYAQDNKIKNAVINYIDNTSTTATLYKWTPDNNNQQVLVLRYSGTATTTYVDVYSKFLATKTVNNQPAVGAQFELLDANLNHIAYFTDNNNGTYIVDNVLVASQVTGTINATFYYRETKAPTHILNSDGSLSSVVAQVDTTLYKCLFQYVTSSNTAYYSEYLTDGTLIYDGGAVANYTTAWNTTFIRLVPSADKRTVNNDWINAQMIPVSFGLSVAKKANDGVTPARGCTFTLYDGSMNVIGSLVETLSLGSYTTGDLSMGAYAPGQTTPVPAVYFYREATPATQIWNSTTNTWVNKTFYLDNNLYRVDMLYFPSTDTMHYSVSIVNPNALTVPVAWVINDAQIANYTNNKIYGVQNLKNEEYGSVEAKKVDASGDVLAGATLSVYNASNNAFVANMTETSTGIFVLDNLPNGTYYLKETVAPTGYQISPVQLSFTIDANHKKVDLKTNPIVNYSYGSIVLDKQDTNKNAVPNAIFGIYSDAACTKLVATMTSTTGSYVYNGLPMNVSNGDFVPTTYYVKETMAPYGYHVDPNVYSATISKKQSTVRIENSSISALAGVADSGYFTEVPVGSVLVEKVDASGSSYVPLSGATFVVYADAACTLVVGTLSETTTGKYSLTGLTLNNDLSAKTYYLKETEAPTGYHTDPNVYSFTISAKSLNASVDNMSLDILSDANLVAKEKFSDIPWGSVSVSKVTLDDKPLSGATFVVYSDAACSSEVGTLSETTVGNYSLTGLTLNNDLSAKTYYLKETEAPTGYHADPNVYSFTISAKNLNASVDNVSFELLADAELVIDDKFVDVPLGSVKVEKVSKDNKPLSGATFVVYSDAACTSEVGTLAEITVGNYSLTGLTLNDDLSDKTYYLLETEAPEGMEVDPTIYPFTISVKELNVTVANNGTAFVNDNPVVGTTITSEVGTAVAPVGEDKEFVDTIEYKSLIGGKTYEIVGTAWLMDRDGNPIVDKNGDLVPVLDKEGNPITSTKTFVAPGEGVVSGTVDVTFTIDTTLLEGSSFYIEEDLYRDGRLIGFHHEVKDQTAFVPEIHTTLISSATDSKLVPNTEEKTTLPDTVDYINLPNGKYVMSGVLMDFNTGKAVVVDGKEVTAESAIFEIANEENKGVSSSVEVVFTLPTSLLADHTLVAFETLYAIKEDGTRVEIAKHNDIGDVQQTAYVPSIGTQFYDRDLGIDCDMVTYSENATLEDKVKLTNVIDGEYTLRAKVMIKETGEPLLDKNGNVQYATTSFTITKEECKDGPITCDKYVTFEGIDTTVLTDKTLVCFEYLERNGVLIAVEADLENPDQTIDVPGMKTTLVEETTQTHTLIIADEITLPDTVAFTGLEIGREVTVVGHLYNADTGAAILNEDGTPVSAETTFTPTVSDGSVVVTFTFKYPSIINVTNVVAFEDLFDKTTGMKLATHADLKDESQQTHKASLSTVASVGGYKTFYQSESVSLTDVNTYSGLCPNRSYTLHAQAYLVDANGIISEFKSNGNDVTAIGTFNASETGSGSTDCITLKFNAKDLEIGQRIVVYETLTDTATGAVVATEYDPSNSDQTVTVVKRPPAPSTGETINFTYPIIASALLTAAITGLWYIHKFNKRYDEENKDN